MELVSVEHILGGGVARRGGLHRRNVVSTMEVRSVRTPQPARIPPVSIVLILAVPAGLGLSSATMINRLAPSLRKRLRGNDF